MALRLMPRARAGRARRSASMKALRSWPTWCRWISSKPSAGELLQPRGVPGEVGGDRGRPRATCSGVTSRARRSKSSASSRSQQVGGGKTFVRHCSWATRSASCSLGAHERWTCSTSRLPSPPLERNAAIICSSLARGWLTVTRPSAHSPTQRAVSTLIAGPTSGGGCRGSVCSFARSTRTSPSCETVSPANSARITSTHSRRRAVRVALSGHGSPVMCSLDASPVPSATHSRPGNISHRVAAAWATIAG